MNILKFTLTILAIAGCWRPFSWTSLIKHILYNAYTLLIISLMYSFTFTQFMEVVQNVDNADDFTNILYILLSLFAACYKILNLWVNHESFVKLIQNLTEGTFKPLVSVEIKIRRKFDKIIKNTTMCYTILVMGTGASHVLVSLLTNFRKRQLRFKGWIPYDYSSFVIFCLTYAHQYVGALFAAFINIACDSLIIGLLLHLCCQITILQYRLEGIVNGQNTVGDCVRQHQHIIEYACATNARLTKIIGFQFIASTFMLCSNLYQLTRITLNANFIELFAYTFCVLVQIFIYCWFGNKLKLMSLQLVDNIFEMEWIALDIQTKRSLLIIMNRAMRPIEFISYLEPSNTIRYTSLVGTSCSFIALMSLLTDFRHNRLTYREWVPYNYSSYITYYLTYAQQMISTFHCASVNVACDTLFCGFLMHICCQIEILEYRLKNILSNQFTLGYCVHHHNRILQYAQVVNMRFTSIIGFQFMASMMVICSTLYQLTKSALSTNHVPLIMYSSCMLTQIFIYCWFGNKVKSKSLQLTDSIFHMEWPILDNSNKKGLLVIMKRAITPIEISTVYILTINLDSFVSLLKTSYSVYNLLGRVQ
ncbi:PREDICTED: odorant receptor 46a, isoform A-like [Vollenhovia emeryi]|uniref:odorant receptor 46a, isoform A-like n=1 Tax=Vollenhovia emeryi TaxID=411798 RepID=UPI0005F4EDC1|nr:PREDICTED: odorant receptor 46a, isoform A-like [Vollenhovia emeryi]